MILPAGCFEAQKHEFDLGEDQVQEHAINAFDVLGRARTQRNKHVVLAIQFFAKFWKV